jgi:arylsulfatase A-like enzyme
LWPEITDIPLLMRHPERRRGRADDRLVSTHDIVPTILGALGIAASRPLGGIDLSPVLSGDGGGVERRSHLTMGYGPNAQIRRGRWALTTTADGTSRQLYDVVEDPGFTTDVSGRHRDVVRELVDVIEADAGGPLPVHDDEAVAARLGPRP